MSELEPKQNYNEKLFIAFKTANSCCFNYKKVLNYRLLG